jgi:hypothetical protein
MTTRTKSATNARRCVNFGALLRDLQTIAAARGWSLSRAVRELLTPAIALERGQLSRELEPR